MAARRIRWHFKPWVRGLWLSGPTVHVQNRVEALFGVTWGGIFIGVMLTDKPGRGA